MNITPVKNLIACSSCLTLSISLLLFVLSGGNEARAQHGSHHRDHPVQRPYAGGLSDTVFDDTPMLRSQQPDTTRLPDPKSVMYKSLMLPGWGQVVNDQAWKVPLVYGLIGGLAWYSVWLTHRYHDYRAAYYNRNPQTPDDLKYGPTPGHIPQNANLEALRNSRDTYRNRRDLVYVGIGLAYGLNVLDAYVFAHMRTFDVSEDLSVRTTLEPGMPGGGYASPGFTLSFELINSR